MNSNNSDGLSSPEKREEVVPGNLKEIYWDGDNNITPSDVRLFLGLFYEKRKINNENHPIYHELDTFAKNVHSIKTIHKKVYREIDNAILCLQQGKIIEEEKAKELNSSHFRTISMLLALKYFFKKSKTFDHAFIDELHRNSPSTYLVRFERKDVGFSEWYLSYPLLLVQAVRFSQWEIVNQDYCFEFFTAKRVKTYLDILFQKWFPEDCADLNRDEIKRVENIFTRLIRWQTIEGQHDRDTSTFGINDIADWGDVKNEMALLDAISFVDNIVRRGGAKFEKKVGEKLKKYRTSDELIKFDLLEILENIIKEEANDDKGNSNDETIKQKVEVWRKRYEQNTKNNSIQERKIIWSYSKPVGELTKSRAKSNWNKLKKHIEHKKPIDNYNCIIHYIFDQKQRKIGFLRKLYESDSFDSYLERFQTPPNLRSLNIEGLSEEKICLIAYEPGLVAKKVYLKNSKDLSDKDPETFLKECFNAICKQYDNKIPLPMVKRVTDLLEYYYVFGKEKTVFLLRIVFDQGKHQINVWLPKEPPETAGHSDIFNHTNRVLVRYLNFLISNYGMCRQFNHVDLDFSSSKDSEHCYKAMMHEPRRCEDCRENLGLAVFDRYLIDVGIKQMETTYSLEKYIQVIERRKMIKPHLFDKPDEQLKLTSKYILGIDIGGTGIKIKFYEITNKESCGYYTLSCQPETNEQKKRTKKLFLKPALKPALHNSQPLEFSMPTLPSEKARMKIKEKNENWKYKDAKEFAEYIVTTIDNRLKDIEASKILRKIISIGFCWPGPIKQNRIASTSGILSNFKGFSNRIRTNQYSDIMELDIADAVKNAFKNKTDTENAKIISVALSNDGDAEAAGLAFSMCNSMQQDHSLNTYKKLFEEHSVAIVKCGTGTAGAVLINGEIQGLNEFGKIVVDLNVDNSENLSKKIDQRWPMGDTNKNFSLTAFRRVMKENGVPDNAEPKITGRDIALILTLDEKNLKKDHEIQLFGVLELLCIADPHIEWGDLVKNDKIKTGITLQFKDGAYKIVSTDVNLNSPIDEHTWWKLANEPLIQPLHLQADEPLSLLASGKPNLLLKLGKHRIARLNILEANKNQQKIEEGIKKIGQDLADVIALLYDIYELKGVVITGGVMNSEEISELCKTGLATPLETYLYDTFHYDVSDREELKNTENSGKGKFKHVVKDLESDDDLQGAKFYFHITGGNQALLGAAILGFDHYIEEEKIKELQDLATKKGGNVEDDIKFLTKREGVKFMQTNSGHLKISVDDRGDILSLI